MNYEEISELTKRYRINNLGLIAKIYSVEEKMKIYKKVSEIIAKKYGDIIGKDEIFDILSSRGELLTAYITRPETRAFYHANTGNIIIQDILDEKNEIGPTLMHEMVHKIGFEKKDPDFMNMVFNESGTEFVAANSLSKEENKDYLFDKLWCIFPQNVDMAFLEICLVNQLNIAVGGNTLEKSILTGKDVFADAIIKKYGELKYVYFKENIKDLALEDNKYWKSYHSLSENERYKKTIEISDKIIKIQNEILENEFDMRLNLVKSDDDARKFLEDLKFLGDNRAKKCISNKNNKFTDESFKRYFDRYKAELGKNYSLKDINYSEEEWGKKYKTKKSVIKENTDDENKTIWLMANEFKRQYKKRGKFLKFLDGLFTKDKKLIDISHEDENKISKFSIDERRSLVFENSSSDRKKNGELKKDYLKER